MQATRCAIAARSRTPSIVPTLQPSNTLRLRPPSARDHPRPPAPPLPPHPPPPATPLRPRPPSARDPPPPTTTLRPRPPSAGDHPARDDPPLPPRPTTHERIAAGSVSCVRVVGAGARGD